MAIGGAEVTPLGYALVPIGVVALLVRPAALLWLGVVAAIFQGGAVLNYVTGGGTVIPVMPFFFVSVLMAVALLVHARRAGWAWERLAAEPRRVVLFLVAFAAWGVASAFLLPRYFAGMLVNPPRASMDLTYGHLLPLHFGHSNLAQAGYLPLAVVFLVFAICATEPLGAARTMYRGLVAATVLALGVGFYQKAASARGWYYPARLIVSNEVTFRSGAYREVTAGLGLRLSSTFSEASYAGAFFAAAFVFFALLAVHSPRRRLLRALIGLMCLGAAALTGSSTAYGCLAVGVVLFLVIEVFAPMVCGRVSPVATALAGLGFVAVGVGALFLPLGPVARVLTDELFQKIHSGSALHRFAADRAAWLVFWHTWGLGVGLGSERPSSLVLYLLSNVGVIGSLVFLGALFALLIGCRRRLRFVYEPERRARLIALQYAFVINLAALVVSIPDVSWPMLWVWWAMLLLELAGPASPAGRVQVGGALGSSVAPGVAAAWRSDSAERSLG
jgi:hypothetical protein